MALVGVTGAAGSAHALAPHRRQHGRPQKLSNVDEAPRRREAKAAMPAVAALSQGLQQVTAETLSAIATEYDVPKKQFDTQCGELYLAFLNACLTAHGRDEGAVGAAAAADGALALGGAGGHADLPGRAPALLAPPRLPRGHGGQRQQEVTCQKFVFLAERILAYDESPEGYRYESLRLQKLFSLTTPDWRQMAEDAACRGTRRPLTMRSSRTKGPTVRSSRRCATRSGSPRVARRACTPTSSQTAATSMLESGTLSPSDKERLTSIESLLGMAPEARPQGVSYPSPPSPPQIYTAA